MMVLIFTLIIILGIVILTAGMAGAVYKYSDSIDRTLYRLSLTLDSGSSSVAARLTYINFSMEKIFKNMSKRAAELLRDDLEAKGTVKVSEVETSQKEILTIARRLSDSGEISLGGSGEAMI